jgi:hypothetical protein
MVNERLTDAVARVFAHGFAQRPAFAVRSRHSVVPLRHAPEHTFRSSGIGTCSGFLDLAHVHYRRTGGQFTGTWADPSNFMKIALSQILVKLASPGEPRFQRWRV